MTQPMPLTRQPMPPATEPLTGNESVIVIQNGRPRQIPALKFVEQLAPRVRVESVDSTVGATYTFKTPFKTILDVIPKSTWINGQRCEATVSNLTTTSMLVGGMITQGSLVASLTPYKAASNGTAVKAVVMGYV